MNPIFEAICLFFQEVMRFQDSNYQIRSISFSYWEVGFGTFLLGVIDMQSRIADTTTKMTIFKISLILSYLSFPIRGFAFETGVTGVFSPCFCGVYLVYLGGVYCLDFLIFSALLAFIFSSPAFLSVNNLLTSFSTRSF